MRTLPLIRLAKPVKLLALTLLAIPLTQCVTTNIPAPTDTSGFYCRVSEPVFWSKRDTEKTVEQIKEHNAVFRRLCRSGK
jgi:hypothetical protein